MERYEDFWQVTEEALRFAVRRLSIELLRDAKFLENGPMLSASTSIRPTKPSFPGARRLRGFDFD